MTARLTLYICLTLVCLSALTVRAQSVITGTTTDAATGKPLRGIIVKLFQGETTKAFGVSDAKGEYKLQLKENLKGKAVLKFSHVSYATEETAISLDGQKAYRVDQKLSQKSVALGEVEVRAKPVRQSGDTLSYNVKSFLNEGDVSLEDGIKRLPGVDVSQSGEIKYMGVPLSAFHIEGMDLLGGKYSLATRNLPADYTTTVQIVRNYHKRKMDEGKPSDEVAMNIKLSKDAKFRLIGQEEAGAGYMTDGEDKILGVLGLTGMMFGNRFQTLCSAKLGNWKNYGVADLTDHIGGSGVATAATSLFRGFDGGSPPQGEYLYQRNAAASANAVQKTDSVTTLRLNVDYAYHWSTNDMSSATTYLASAGEYVTVSEQSAPLTETHATKLAFNYLQNDRNKYTDETFSLKAQFERNEGDVVSNGTDILQHRRSTAVEANNVLYISRYLGEHRYNFNSLVTFRRSPTLRLSFNNNGRLYGQTAESTSLQTSHSTSLDVKISEKLVVNLPIAFLADYDFVETQRQPESDRNSLHGWTLVPSLNPGFEWQNANRRLYAAASVGLSLRLMRYGETSLTKFFADPRLSLTYTFSANNKLTASASINHSSGDILDLLTDSIRTDYRSTRTASGVIGESSSWTGGLGWKLQLPLHYFTLNAHAAYSGSKRNTLFSQSVSGVDVSSAALFRDTRSRSASFSVSATKNIPSLLAKFGVRGNCALGRGEQAVDGAVISNRSLTYGANGHASIMPLAWLEIGYDINYGWSRTSYAGTHYAVNSLSHNGSAHFYPIKQLELSVNYSYVRHQITTDTYKHMSLFNASAQYKHKRFTLQLSLDNLLNQRSYSYTVFDGVNTYSYDYGLCGRTIFTKLIFKL